MMPRAANATTDAGPDAAVGAVNDAAIGAATSVTASALTATLTLAEAAVTPWDVVVVGAGPAGSVAAYAAAQRGLRVLLLDKSRFPRGKVCGGCLSLRACRALQAIGLGELLPGLGARPIQELSLHAGPWQARLSLPGGYAVSRTVLDAALIRAAVAGGASFIPEVRAVGPAAPMGSRATSHAKRRRLDVIRGADRCLLEAAVIVIATGLAGAGAAPGLEHGQAEVQHGSRIGLGLVLPCRPEQRSFRDGVITMACGTGGYVGVARVARSLLDVAAAVDPAFVRRMGGPGRALTMLLDECGLPLPQGMLEAAWKGTPALTRRVTRVAAERVLLIGDAAGYVEPFTGEGMAWAFESALLAAPLIAAGTRSWTPDLELKWSQHYRRCIASRQRFCHWVAWTLRRPALAQVATAALALLPQISSPFLAGLNRSRLAALSA